MITNRHSAFYCSLGKEKKNGLNPSACISGGSYRFSFNFIIPDKHLPTSFEGRHGNIRYCARQLSITYYLSLHSLVRAKLRGKFIKNGNLEIPVVIVCSTSKSEVAAQKDTQVRPASQRPKRKGKTSLTGDLNDSNLKVFDQEEGDNVIVNPMCVPVKTHEGNFTDIVNQYDLTNSYREIATREEYDTHF